MAASDHDREGDDAALVLAVQQGDGAAFDALFRRHYPAVRSACARRLVDPVEADEVAQAAFVRAFERIDQCRGPRRFGPWIHVIARSLCMDAFRARARVEPFEEPVSDRPETRPNEPEESLLRDERAAHVHQALAALPERQRSAVIARDWEGLRPPEIAAQLGLSIGAVDSLLLRARRRLALSYRRLAGEAGGGASTRTIRAAAVATVLALFAGPHAVVAASAAAADAVQGTASRAAAQVVDAVVTVAATLGAPVTPPPDAPAPPTDTVKVVPPAPATHTGSAPPVTRGTFAPTRQTHIQGQSPSAGTPSAAAGTPTAAPDATTVPDPDASPDAGANPASTTARPRPSATVPDPTTSTTVVAAPVDPEATTDSPGGSTPVDPPTTKPAPPTPTTIPVPKPAPTPPPTTVPPPSDEDQTPVDVSVVAPVTTSTMPDLLRNVARS